MTKCYSALSCLTMWLEIGTNTFLRVIILSCVEHEKSIFELCTVNKANFAVITNVFTNDSMIYLKIWIEGKKQLKRTYCRGLLQAHDGIF